MSFLQWKDPLTTLPEISRHPSIDSSTGSSDGSETESLLPSVFENLNEAFALLDKAHQALDEYAHAHSDDDDTRALLNAFLDHLPTKGQEVLASEIALYAGDHGKIRALRNFLVDAILKPRMSSFPQSPSATY
jgi:hypothetical protein